ncbi:MAG: BatA domain-containing protein [Gemmatimonadales bacterium]
MPFGFLLPAFLAGLAALAVPIVLHLRQREREKPQPFPSLMFLSRIPIRTAQRRRITDWPLLLLRALALALLIAAFARPLLQSGLAAEGRAGRSVAILFDRSLSMGHRESWNAARDSARRVIAALSPTDRVAVVAFDEEASVPQPFTTDHAAATAAIDRLVPGARGTHYAAAWRAARQLLGSDSTATAELVMITDLQRVGGGAPEGVSLPAGVTLRTIAVGPSSAANSAVASIEIEQRAGEGRGSVVVAARIRSYALPAPRKVKVTLTLGGRLTGTRETTLPTSGSTRVAFDPVPLPAGDLPVTVAVEPDALAADDVLNAVIPAEAARRVILVTPPDATADETVFLERALTIGTDPKIAIERRLSGAVDAAGLRGAAAVILYDVAPPSGSTGSALIAWVAAGGGVVIAAGPRLAARGIDGSFSPGRLRGLADRSTDRGGTLGELVEEHPIFSPFRGGATAALGSARYLRYARVEAQSGARVLARFDDGLPALLERREAAGRVLLVAAPLDDRAGDFPRQAAYLPFVRRLVLYAAGGDGAPLWHTTGAAWRPAVAVPDLVVSSPSGELLRPDSAHGGAIVLTEAGVYSAFRERAVGAPAAMVAANPPAAESDLTRLNADELLLGVADSNTTAATKGPPTSTELEQRQQLWRIFLMVVALLLVVETWLVGRGWRANAGRIVTVPDGGAE